MSNEGQGRRFTNAPPPPTTLGGAGLGPWGRRPEARRALPRPLRYPAGFPEAFLACVALARDTAEATWLNEAKSAAPSLELTNRFVDAVFAAFGHQACEGWRQGKLPRVRIDDAVREFLPGLAEHAYDVCGMSGVNKGTGLWSRDEFVSFSVGRVLESDLWRRHLEDRTTTEQTADNPQVDSERLRRYRYGLIDGYQRRYRLRSRREFRELPQFRGKMTDTALGALVRGERNKHSAALKLDLLDVLGISEGDWDNPK